MLEHLVCENVPAPDFHPVEVTDSAQVYHLVKGKQNVALKMATQTWALLDTNLKTLWTREILIRKITTDLKCSLLTTRAFRPSTDNRRNPSGWCQGHLSSKASTNFL